MHPTILTVAGSASNPVFAGVFEQRPGPVPLTRFGLISGAVGDPNSIQHWDDQAHQNGWRMTGGAVYGDPGSPRYAGIWPANDRRLSWSAAGIADDGDAVPAAVRRPGLRMGPAGARDPRRPRPPPVDLRRRPDRPVDRSPRPDQRPVPGGVRPARSPRLLPDQRAGRWQRRGAAVRRDLRQAGAAARPPVDERRRRHGARRRRGDEGRAHHGRHPRRFAVGRQQHPPRVRSRLHVGRARLSDRAADDAVPSRQRLEDVRRPRHPPAHRRGSAATDRHRRRACST